MLSSAEKYHEYFSLTIKNHTFDSLLSYSEYFALYIYNTVLVYASNSYDPLLLVEN